MIYSSIFDLSDLSSSSPTPDSSVAVVVAFSGAFAAVIFGVCGTATAGDATGFSEIFLATGLT